nr:hypothetical protein GCM10025730_05640 [Promicromonospora thailandica]
MPDLASPAGVAHGAPAQDPAPPPWLRTAAGWSWRLILVVAGIALVFWAVTQVLIVFVAVFLALVFTAVLNPVTDFYARVLPRPLATAGAILSGILVIGGLLAYVVVSVAGQWERLAGSSTPASTRSSTSSRTTRCRSTSRSTPVTSGSTTPRAGSRRTPRPS